MKEQEQNILPVDAKKFLKFFCLSCGSYLSSEIISRGSCNCGAVLTITTTSALAEGFEAAPDGVKAKILEQLQGCCLKLWGAQIFEWNTRVVLEAEEGYLGQFCMACGEFLSGDAFVDKKCQCGAIVSPATQEQILVEFEVATEEAKLKILRYIEKNRFWLYTVSCIAKTRQVA